MVVEGSVDDRNARTFLDLGANSQFINTQFAQKHNIPVYPLERPQMLSLADGKKTLAITHIAKFNLDIGKHKEEVIAWVADLEYDVVLGRPWFNKHQPSITFATGTVTFESNHCTQHCSDRKTVTIQETSQKRENTKKQPHDDIQEMADQLDRQGQRLVDLKEKKESDPSGLLVSTWENALTHVSDSYYGQDEPNLHNVDALTDASGMMTQYTHYTKALTGTTARCCAFIQKSEFF